MAACVCVWGHVCVWGPKEGVANGSEVVSTSKCWGRGLDQRLRWKTTLWTRVLVLHRLRPGASHPLTPRVGARPRSLPHQQTFLRLMFGGVPALTFSFRGAVGFWTKVFIDCVFWYILVHKCRKSINFSMVLQQIWHLCEILQHQHLI